MATTHVHTEPQSESERSGYSSNGLVGLHPTGNAKAGTPSQLSHRASAHIWALLRGDVILAAVSKPVLAFDDWISDPPMTERERIKHYIVETRKASTRRRLAGR